MIPEPELMERMRPGGKYETTAAPEITRVGSTVKIRCATEGASIGYTTESGDDARWLLYGSELKLERGTVLRAKAIRIGFNESSEAKVLGEI